jgi:hypothetical protein
MRFAGLALLALIIILFPTQGHAGNGLMVGMFTCKQQLPCDLSDPFYASGADLIPIANACVGHSTSTVVPPEGFFDETAGIDSSGCLTPTSETPKGNATGGVTPQCCITTLPSGACTLHCSLVAK